MEYFIELLAAPKNTKANLGDVIAVTHPVILLKLDSNYRFWGPYDLEIWWVTSKNNRALFLCYVKLCRTFQSHGWIQTGGTVWKRPIWVKIGDFFVSYGLEIWRMTLKNNRAPLLYYVKLCASFHSHQWIQTGVRGWKCSIRVKIDFFVVWHWNLRDDLQSGNTQFR